MLNSSVTKNCSGVTFSFLYIPIVLILGIVVILLYKNSINAEKYVEFQKELFFYLNQKLCRLNALQHNITQLGNAFITFSLLGVFVLYAIKVWEMLVVGSLFSLIFSKGLKSFFDIPRPVMAFGKEQVCVVGETLSNYSSFPSGHSITIFTMLTVLMFSFVKKTQSKKNWLRIIYFSFFIIFGGVVALSRVAVGAHFPIDVFVGSVIGYISGILGILVVKKFILQKYISNRKYYPFFIITFGISSIVIIFKIINENLLIYYLSLASLIISLCLITRAYVREIRKNYK